MVKIAADDRFEAVQGPCNAGWLRRGMPFLAAFLPILLLLSGCMYPGKENGGGSATGYRDSVTRIQTAVDAFYSEKGILPILNADETVPRYEKFRIDLDLLNREGYLDDIPRTAFEKGGSVYFLLLDEERDPTVKIMDLVTVQTVNDAQRKVDGYRRAHHGNLPAGDERYPGLYTIDGEKAGTKGLKLKSVYSGQEMELIMDKAGKVYADYSYDIMSVLDRSGGEPAADEDLRRYLLDRSWFVPVKSLPYYLGDGRPVPKGS